MMTILVKDIKRVYINLNILELEKFIDYDCKELIQEISQLDFVKVDVYFFQRGNEVNNIGGLYNLFLNDNQTVEQLWQKFGKLLAHIYIIRESPLYEIKEVFIETFTSCFCIPSFLLDNLSLPSDKNKAIALISNIFKVENKFAVKRLEIYESEKIVI